MYAVLVPYVISVAVTIWLGTISWRRRSIPGAQLFAYLSFAEAIWTFGYIFQLLSSSQETLIFWNNVQFIGAILAPLFYLGFALEFDQPFARSKRISWKYYAPLALALLFFVWSDPWHGLFRGEISIIHQEPFSFLKYTETPGFALYTIYAYSLVILTTLILVARLNNSTPLFKLQISIILIGILIPWSASIMTALHLLTIELHELVPITFGIGNLIIAWGLFRYKLFEVIPIARDFLFEHLTDGVFVFNHRLNITDMNPAAQKILGFELPQLLGKKITDLLPIPMEWFSEANQKEVRIVEMALNCGQPQRYYEARLSGFLDKTGKLMLYILTLHDIHERKLLEEKLFQQAQTDALTGIPNRRHITLLANIEIERALRCGHNLSIILFDIDHFKRVNDVLGHTTGDKTLQLLASECQNDLREYDVLGRYGGEEFILILPNTDLPTAILVAERIRNLVEELPVKSGEIEMQITISLGITQLAGRQGVSLEQLVDEADKALYQAKKDGRNQTCYFTTDMLVKYPLSLYVE